MVDFKKIINSTKLSFSLNKKLIKTFVDLIFQDADKNTKAIQDEIKLLTGHTIKINKTNTAETCLVLFGCCFGLLTTNGSGLITSNQGKKIEKISKEIIKETFAESQYLIEKIDKYKNLYNKELKMYYHPTGIFLQNFAGEDIDKIFTGNPEVLNPLLHKKVMSILLAMSLTPTLIFKKT